MNGVCIVKHKLLLFGMKLGLSDRNTKYLLQNNEEHVELRTIMVASVL